MRSTQIIFALAIASLAQSAFAQGVGNGPPRQIVNEFIEFNIPEGSFGAPVSFSAVPDGKILVVETINCSIDLPDSNAVSRCEFFTDLTPSAPKSNVNLPISVGPGNFTPDTILYNGLFTGRIYVRSGATPELLINTQTAASSELFGNVSISGYLVAATSPALSP